MEKTIAVIRGDGIGPEIVEQAIAVLDTAAKKFGHSFCYTEAPMGGCAIDEFGVPATVCCSARSAARSGTRSRRKTVPKRAC